MPILIRDLADCHANVVISCPQCSRVVVLAGPYLLAQRFDLNWSVEQAMQRLRCQRCGMIGELLIKFSRLDIARERSRRPLPFNDPWPSDANAIRMITIASDEIEARMCNLYSATTAPEAMRNLFGVDAEHDHLGNAEPRAAIWPKYPGPVVRLNPDGARELVEMAWGFLTKKVSKKTGKELKPAAWNNARGDKVLTSGLWRESFRERRCLVPASSFREAKGQRPATDYWFALKGDTPRPPFAFAGMWRYTQAELRQDATSALTHTIITTTANDIVRPVHPNRMPVILDPVDYDAWLHGSAEDAEQLLRPYPAERMQIVQQGVGLLHDETC